MKKPVKNILICYLLLYSQSIIAQCYPDRHSTSWYDSWVSCNKSNNPIGDYGNSHWILYNLGYEYVLNDTKIWNLNEPNALDNGINEYAVDYSLDGNNWTHLGNYTLNMASGTSIYEGENGPDFNGVKAQFVLITPISNFGGNCYGFSELKINITDPFETIDESIGFNASVYPNPFIDDINLRIKSLYENTPLTYSLYDIMGRNILNNEFSLQDQQETYNLQLNGHKLAIGIYILTIEQKKKFRSFKLIKRE